MSRVADRLVELGESLPAPAPALGAYVAATRVGNIVFSSGQLPVVDGKPLATGTVGADVTAEDAQKLARVCAINAIAAVSTVADVDSIKRVLKVTGFVASAPDFGGQPGVINGASNLLADVFGEDGLHARSAVGVAALPMNMPVEVEIIVEVAE